MRLHEAGGAICRHIFCASGGCRVLQVIHVPLFVETKPILRVGVVERRGKRQQKFNKINLF